MYFPKARLLARWEQVRGSYWFIPSLITLAAIGLAQVTLAVDHSTWGRGASRLPWLYTGTADGARQLLATIAGSMIGLAGVVFSIVIVALTLATNQFGPRLLRNFMHDTANQVVLGTFVASFIYCLLILRQVHGGQEEHKIVAFVPQISILVAVTFAVAGLGFLIFFIHHTAASIQAPNVIANVTNDLCRTIDELYPERTGEAASLSRVEPPDDFDERSAPVLSNLRGYVHRIETSDLLSAAIEQDVIVRIECRPGHWIQEGMTLLRVYPGDRVTDDLTDRLLGAYATENQRSPTQDVEFAVDQLVEIALRALSPGINDPFTAMQCLDQLGAALARLADRSIPSPMRVDPEGKLRVIAYPTGFENVADAAFNQFRQHAKGSLAVLLRMMEVCVRIATVTASDSAIAVLARHAGMTRDLAMRIADTESDRDAVRERADRLEECLALRRRPQ